MLNTHVLFLINGSLANKNTLLRQLHHAFEGCHYTVLQTEYAKHAIQLVSHAAATAQYSHYIAIGGDGSLNEMVNGLLLAHQTSADLHLAVEERYRWHDLLQLSVGLISSGTGNDFARTILPPTNFAELRHSIEQQHTRTIAVGYASYTNTEGQATERFFMNITDVGLGGAVAVRISDRKNRWLSPKMLYNKAIVQTFFSYQKTTLACSSSNGFAWQGKSMGVITANGKFFGSGIGIAPDASLDNEQLQVVIMGDITLWDYIKNLPTALRCQHIKNPQVWYQLLPDLSIKPTTDPLPIDMDGEFVGYAPMFVCKLANKLRFIVAQQDK